jgi:hypothetical protein
MSPAGSHPANPPPADRDASTRARTERQMVVLDRLIEIGMEIAEAAGRLASDLADGASGQSGADPGLAYSRAARAVRLTIALQTRLTEGLTALDEARRIARVGGASRRRRRIHRLIEDAAETQGCEADGVERLSFDAWERLTEVDDDDLLDRPFEDVVAQICLDLGLSPAWAASAFAGPDDLRPDAAKKPPPAGPRAPASPATGITRPGGVRGDLAARELSSGP